MGIGQSSLPFFPGTLEAQAITAYTALFTSLTHSDYLQPPGAYEGAEQGPLQSSAIGYKNKKRVVIGSVANSSPSRRFFRPLRVPSYVPTGCKCGIAQCFHGFVGLCVFVTDGGYCRPSAVIHRCILYLNLVYALHIDPDNVLDSNIEAADALEGCYQNGTRA
jgi:hypothetical protein